MMLFPILNSSVHCLSRPLLHAPWQIVAAVLLLHNTSCTRTEIAPRRDVSIMSNSLQMAFVHVPAGQFTMGSNDPAAIRRGDGPAHSVTLSKGFWIGAYEVTQAEYKAIMGTNPSRFAAGGDKQAMVEGMDTSRLPVDQVSWEEAVEFCRRLTEMPEEERAGRRYRLPTDAEWEYACRAADHELCPVDCRLDSSMANINAPIGTSAPARRPMPVGSYSPNRWGLYDMHGNVAEWCRDGKRAYTSRSVTDPQGAPAFRSVLRGGAWDLPANYASCHHRIEALRGYVFFGFRIVCERNDKKTPSASR